ncbi:MAG: DUF3857 domain-containing protein [Bacteriovoracia bacterium]
MKYFLLISLTLVSNLVQARWTLLSDHNYKIKNYQTVIKVNKIGAATSETNIEYEILKDQGRKDLSILKFSYDPLLSVTEILEAKIITNQIAIEIDKNNITTINLGSRDGSDELKEIRLTVPSIKIGSTLKLKYRETQKKPILTGYYSLRKDLDSLGYVEQFSTEIISEIPLSHHINDPENKIEFEEKKAEVLYSYRFKTKSLFNRTLISEPGKLSESDKTFFTLKSESEWSKIQLNFQSRFQKLISSPLPLSLAEVISEAKQKKSLIEKVEFLTNYLAENYKYLGDWQNMNNAFIPRSFDSIVQSRNGNCKDLSLLLMRMLKEIQINASIAFVQRSAPQYDKLKKDHHATLDSFNHVVVAIKQDEKYLWIDPTKNSTYGFNIRKDIAGKKALILDDTSALVDIPHMTPPESKMIIEKTIDFTESSASQVKTNIKLTGALAYPFIGIENDATQAKNNRQILSLLDEPTHTVISATHNFDFKNRTYRPMNIDLNYTSHSILELNDKIAFLRLASIEKFIAPILQNTKTWQGHLIFDEVFEIIQTSNFKNLFTKDGIDECAINSKWLDYRFSANLLPTGTVLITNLTLKEKYIDNSEFKTSDFIKMQNELRKCIRNQSIEVALGQKKHINLVDDIEKSLKNLEVRKKAQERYNIILRTSRKNKNLIKNKVYIKLASKNIQEDPAFDRSFIWLSNNILTNGFEDEGKYTESILGEASNTVVEGLKYNPESQGLKLVQVQIFIIQNDQAKALELLNQIQIDPETSLVEDIIALSRIKRSLNKHQEADALLSQTLLRKNPKWAIADINTELAISRKKLNDFTGCVEFYQKVLSIDRYRTYLYTELPLCLYKLNQLDEAIKISRQGLTISETSQFKKTTVSLLMQRLQGHIAKKDFISAETDIRESIQINPTEELYLKLSQVLVLKGEVNSVAAVIKDGEKYAENCSTYLLKAALITQQNNDSALKFAQGALDCAEDRSARLQVLGYLVRVSSKDANLNKKYRELYQSTLQRSN